MSRLRVCEIWNVFITLALLFYTLTKLAFIMNKKIFCAILVVFSVLLSIYAYSEKPQINAMFGTAIEALSDSEGEVILCRCQTGFLTNDKCKVTNTDGICAQSKSGENVLCGTYNSNC